jgi:uncharacterized protein YaaW (UPF0174 family)
MAGGENSMSLAYGFNFCTLYQLELQTLLDIVHLIRGDRRQIARDQDIIIRGCILPFLRSATKAPEGADKDQVLREALCAVAKELDLSLDDWDQADTGRIASLTRLQIQQRLGERLEGLDPQERALLLGAARESMYTWAKTMGIPLAGAGAVVAGEMSGFGAYMATTAGLHALSVALGTTFSWSVYQGATTLLGIVLGPVGWTLAGAGVAVGLAGRIRSGRRAKKGQKLTLVAVALLLAIGENPFDFFGLPSTACWQDVKRTYRAMVKTLHPDTLEKGLPAWLYDDFNTKLLRCQEAYERLETIFGQSEEVSDG